MDYANQMQNSIRDDAELVALIRQGNLGAFECLYNRHKQAVYRTALAITGDPGAAEELLQDTFVRAYRAVDRIDTSLPLSPWLHRIVVNLSYNWRTRYRPWVALGSLVERIVATRSDSPEYRAEDDELRGIVEEAIDSLTTKHRVVIVLYYLHGFQLAEIADILDCPLGTVKSRLHYACRDLAQRLSQDRRLAGRWAYSTS